MSGFSEEKHKFLIIGSGLSGASLARLLFDSGNDVTVIEKTNRVGGLCVTDVHDNGTMYEPYGARTFHSRDKNIIDFVSRFDVFNGYTHHKGMILNKKLFPFPITKQSIDLIPERKRILLELINRPKCIDLTNFETAAISLFGKTLYRYFISNYTEKMWGIPPRKLTAEWAPKRLGLRDEEAGVFPGEWQGLPVHGYSYWLEKMLERIKVIRNCNHYDTKDYDVVVSTAPIDSLLDFKFGKLGYRSLNFKYKIGEFWEDERYGTINLPQHPQYFRKCNFSILHKQQSVHDLIQYQEATAEDETHDPMYPINTKRNNVIFDKYLREMCKTKICPHGRLGLFKYLDMDEAIEVSFKMVEIVKKYPALNAGDRYKSIKSICQSI